ADCGPMDDGMEPNDSSAQAAKLESPGLYSGLMSCNDNEDWYAVELEAGQLFEAALNFDAVRAGLKLEIYAPSDLTNPAVTSGALSDGRIVSAEYVPSSSGTHYL